MPSLELWCFESNANSPGSLGAFKECIRPIRLQLKVLIIDSNHFTTADDLISNVLFLPNLKKLVLKGVRFVRSDPTTLTGAPEGLFSIELVGFPQLYLLYDWFQSFSENIISLDADVNGVGTSDFMRGVEIFKSVEHLRITTLYHGLSLRNLVNLRTITLGSIIIGLSHYGGNSWTPETVQRLLSSISSPHIIEITCPVFLIWLDNIEFSFSQFSWQGLDRVLAESRFSRLAAFNMPVTLDVWNATWRAKHRETREEPIPVSSFLRRRLPRLDESGVLKITTSGWMEVLPYYRVS